MLELLILISTAITFFCIGNITGWSSKSDVYKRENIKRQVELYAKQQSYYKQDEELYKTATGNNIQKSTKEELINNLLKFRLEYDPKTHMYHKVEEVEAELLYKYNNVLPFPKQLG